jgi:hypothetical protein
MPFYALPNPNISRRRTSQFGHFGQSGFAAAPRLQPRCYRLTLQVPSTFAALEEAVRRWIATCVMSRTLQNGVPVHREVALVNGNASLAELWTRNLRLRIGQSVAIIAEYLGTPNGVDAVRFSTNVPVPPSPAPTCANDFAQALNIERAAARCTLDLSAQVANNFIRTLGALNARGRFTPTIIDNKYWFAKLYEYITYEEIAAIGNFRQPAFVMHFIPIFYGLYYQALQNWNNRNKAAVSPLWTNHFTLADRPDNGSIGAWMAGLRVSIVTGVTAHVQGDMANALEQAYRTYVAKYCLSPPPRFDEFRADFFDRNRPVFDRSKADFLLHASQFGPLPVGPELGQFLFAVGEPLAGGLDVDEVYRWRDAAWSEARRRLGQ